LQIKQTLTAALAITLLLPNNSFAMGSGNRFEDAQVGLDYVVFSPKQTLNLQQASFTMQNCHNNHDEALLVQFGKANKYFQLHEFSTEYFCSINKTLVKGAIRTTLTKPGKGMLTGTNIFIDSKGLSRSEISIISQSLTSLVR
jgi:hypothetical protein